MLTVKVANTSSSLYTDLSVFTLTLTAVAGPESTNIEMTRNVANREL
jgi:hypothetical protein